MLINDIIKIVKKHPRIKLHIDAVQGIGKINPSFSFNDIDMFTCSSHKLHGLKGTGCLLYNKNINLNFLQGGHQQHGIRPGTVDVAGVVTTAKTIQMYGSFNKENYNEVYANYIYLVDKLSTLPFLIINKSKHAFSPYILSVTFCKIKGETVLHSLEEKGIYVSTGSACNSHSKDLDNTLMAFTKSETYAINTIRISLDYTTSKNEIDILINNIKMIGEK
jgi:cysteine desulfurase